LVDEGVDSLMCPTATGQHASATTYDATSSTDHGVDALI
jgi:hypothetical protein